MRLHCKNPEAMVRAVVAGSISLCVAAPATATTYRVVDAFAPRVFTKPVDLQSPRDRSGRLYVVEQPGRIVVANGRPDAPAFLDIRERVDARGNEMGLLGLCFDPNYATTRRFFVYYTARSEGRSVGRVARFAARAGGATADAASERVILEVEQPWSNHNGGQVAFGPDGFLYIGLGDGGSAGDPNGNGQNPGTLLGSILRIDVSGESYRVPPDNPFAVNSRGWRGEIWAYGLRNPWRFSFDAVTGALWAGDVGQDSYEEVDRVEKGRNYGWNCREGFHEFKGGARACAGARDLIAPIVEYGRREGISVTGGYVYRGKLMPELVGRFLYADYAAGRLWALSYDGRHAENALILDTDLLISSFGVDENGEIYLCHHDASGGTTAIYRLEVAR